MARSLVLVRDFVHEKKKKASKYNNVLAVKRNKKKEKKNETVVYIDNKISIPVKPNKTTPYKCILFNKAVFN